MLDAMISIPKGNVCGLSGAFQQAPRCQGTGAASTSGPQLVAGAQSFRPEPRGSPRPAVGAEEWTVFQGERAVTGPMGTLRPWFNHRARRAAAPCVL